MTIIGEAPIIPLSSHLSHFILVVLKEVAGNACLPSDEVYKLVNALERLGKLGGAVRTLRARCLRHRYLLLQ